MTFARVFLLLALIAPSWAAEVTTLPGEAADLVRGWFKEGTAAGNTGDYYDNRDRGHMLLNLSAFPQLTKITYQPSEVTAYLDYASPKKVLTNKVVIANSSTARSVLDGGSNTRHLYTRPYGVGFAYELYVFNNLHAFPEHNDHDPGHNGFPSGWGDVYPLNTPYVYTSQGSSGSELRFMEAAALTLAAFRPDVKQKLIQKGLLMPTLQMLLRTSYKPASESGDYLTGKAHPSVFESNLIDAAAMVRGAHGITLDTIPPIAKLRVLEEDRPRNSIDFFGTLPTERLCDTPCAIGRVFRGSQRTRRIVVSADESFDQNFRKLTWTWAVLRGDTNRIQIKPLNSRNSTVEITIAYHERRPIFPGAPIDSNRIDIGCFVHNGAYYSAPSFVCYYFPDDEARGYDTDGKLLDIGYNAGDTRVTISDWQKFFELIDQGGARAEFLKNRLSEDEWNTLKSAGAGYASAAEAERAAREAERPIHEKYYRLLGRMRDFAAKSPDKTNEIAQMQAELAPVDTVHNAAEKSLKEAGDAVKTFLSNSSRAIETLVSTWVANPNFTFTDRRDLDRLYKAADRATRDAFEQGKELLVTSGLMKSSKGMDFAFTPIRAKAGPLEERLTPYEKILVERLNAAAVSLLILRGCATSSFTENYVDSAIGAKKEWRDVYHHDTKGDVSGWTRYTPGAEPAEFNSAGQLVESGKARPVAYKTEAPTNGKSRLRLTWSASKLP